MSVLAIKPVVLSSFSWYILTMGKFPLLDKPAVVYVAVNKVNGKRYIGATTVGIKRRMQRHESSAKLNVNRGAFHSAIRKYGIDAFEWSILSEHDTAMEAARAEKDLIETTRPEYNSTPGGLGFHPRIWSEDQRKLQGERTKAWLAERGHPMLGRKQDPEVIERVRQANIGRTGYWKGKNLPAHVCAMISERMAKRPDKLRVLALGPKASAKKIVCLNDGKQFESASDASRHYDIDTSSIISVCKRKRRQANELVFRYLGDHSGGLDEVNQIRNAIHEGRCARAAMAREAAAGNNGRKRRVVCVNDGLVFDSIQSAARHYGKHEETVGKMCREDGKPGRDGRKFVFAEDEDGA